MADSLPSEPAVTTSETVASPLEPPTAPDSAPAEPASVVLAVDNPAPPDPAEIVAPASAPRRGWWRRSV
jgi:hypothetical protein